MNPDDHPSMNELRKAVIDQKKAFLPAEAEDPSLAALHQAVTTYDQLVSQLVMEMMQGMEAQVSDQQVQQAQARLALLLAAHEAQPHPKLNQYRTYAARLDHMLALAQNLRAG